MSEQVKKVSEEHLSKLQELNQNFANLFRSKKTSSARRYRWS